MWNKVSISSKLVLLFLCFGLLPMGLVGYMGYDTTQVLALREAERFEMAADNIAEKITAEKLIHLRFNLQ